MNTANITGRASAIYGIGPTEPPLSPESRLTVESYRERRALRNSAFIAAVRDAFRPPNMGTDGGAFGTSGRFIVGGFSDAVVIAMHRSPEAAAEIALRYAADHPYGGLGLWRDGNTGRVWLDVVQGFDDVTEALSNAARNGELAIWDSVRDHLIDV